MVTTESKPKSIDGSTTPTKVARRGKWKFTVVIRRIHLYAGLFLLPWVILYGTTAALFNHENWLPDAQVTSYPAFVAEKENAMRDFPSAAQLAQQVVEAINKAKPESEITLASDYPAEFTNPVMFEIYGDGKRFTVRIDPVSSSSEIFEHEERTELTPAVWSDLHNVQINPNPQQIARQAAANLLKRHGVQNPGESHPHGWTKLNFIANIDQSPARVTYVLRDGHIDVTEFTGKDGMSLREYLLRLHTSHGQTPHRNARTIWSLFVDLMAFSMLMWAATGIVMWWQIKRTRWIGALIILTSIAMATAMFVSMSQFYAGTLL